VYTTVYGPCARPCTGRGREQPCTRSTAMFTVRTRLCTRAINTLVYRVHSRARPCTGHGRTMYMALARSCTQSVHGPGHVPCTLTALYTGRKHGRVQVHDRVHGRVPVQGRVCGPCIRPSTATYRLCTRPCTGHVHGTTMIRTWPYFIA